MFPNKMIKFKKSKYYPVDFRKKVIYHVSFDTKKIIENKVKGKVPVFLAKRGDELNKKGYYAMDFDVKDEKDYEKAVKRRLFNGEMSE